MEREVMWVSLDGQVFEHLRLEFSLNKQQNRDKTAQNFAFTLNILTLLKLISSGVRSLSYTAEPAVQASICFLIE